MTEQAQKQPYWEERGFPAHNIHMTLEEFEALPETNLHIEWHDGMVVYPDLDEEHVTVSPPIKHARIKGNVLVYLMGLLPHHRRLYPAPIAVQLDRYIVQPDILWIAEDSSIIEHDTHFEGAPTLIIEVISAHNRLERVTKYELYERSGVKEYWLVDYIGEFIEVYTLKNGKYQRFGAFIQEQEFTSPALGKAVDAKVIFDGSTTKSRGR